MTRNLSVLCRVSSVAIAVSLAAGPSPAAAQSLQGTPTVTSGAADISEGAGSTTVTVGTSQTVIDWAPDDNAVGNFGAINFQPSGTTATFQNNVDLVGDFAVLNRINVADQSRIVALNGTIESLVNGQTGGSIFFYSPSGFVLTGTSVINVGSLVLSASPITVDGNGNFINGGTVSFGQAPNPGAAINTVSDINGTSQINANGAGSYVALVAPRINHQGDIRTDGTAALVAAEAATIIFSPDGLFDIEVSVGTDDPNGIAIDGGTIGRNSETEGVYDHRAYLVAVAKNDAVTMVINNGGSVGFDTATSAAVEDNVVVLSGGYDVENGDHWTTSGTSQVNLLITNANLSSDVDAKVTGGAAINSIDGALTFGGDLSIIGGETTTTGGNVLIDARNGNALTIGGDLYARAFRRNADGSQTGLLTRLGAETASTVTVGGDVTLDSDSFGADAEGTGLNGTQAIGGNAQINIGANSTLNVAGSVSIHADGYGGDNFYGDGAGGNGIGGQVFLMSINGGATVDIGGPVYVSAQGYGGSAGECSVCNITGGNGIGGNATVHTGGGTNQMSLGSDVTITVAGHGGAGDAQAGAGAGGFANLGAFDASVLTVGADTEIDASGFGGYGFDNVGGFGLGGEARVSTNSGGSVELDGPVFISADGQGGDGGSGGNGTGGWAYISAFLGTVHAFSDVTVTANSSGGSVIFGSGTGGSGIADLDTETTAEMTEASLVASGGTLIIDGLTTVTANATGGDGGFNGGTGGDAVAAGVPGTIRGGAVIHAANSDSGPSVIQLGNVIISADAQGGAGANGQGGTNGSDAGDGGDATGGRVVVTAAAGSGDLSAEAVAISASATGGTGGNGGGGDGGSGGDGGDGGSATGGFINVGTESGDPNFAQGANNGVADITTVVALATATGGDGGDGGFGNLAGIGGTGGDAFGGSSVLLVRGSELTVGDVTLDASAFGGNGGLSPNAPDGDGGDATAGIVGVLVTNRFQLPNQRGTLFAGDITGTANAVGGTGGINDGLSLTAGGNLFAVINSDATIDSVSLVTQADAYDGGADNASASYIEIQNGIIEIAGNFVFETPGPVAVWADGATLSAAQIFINADNFIHDDSVPAPATVGTFSADGIFLTTDQDLIVDGHLVSAATLDLFAPGLIDIEDATSTGGDLILQAGTTISGGAQTAAGHVIAGAPGNIMLGDVSAGTFIDILSDAGALSLGSLTAGSFIDLEAGGNILFLDVAADELDFDSGGAVTGGNIIAGTFAGGEAEGAVSLGNISVGIEQEGGPTEDGFAIGIASATSITVGDVEADEAIGFATLGDLTTGDLSAGTDVMTLVGGDTTIASITTPGGGRTYHGDVQMFLDAGGPDDFDPTLVFAQDPVQSGGAYTVTGAIATGSLQVGAVSISTGNITAFNGVWLDAAGSVATGAIDTGLLTIAAGTDISTGDIFAFDGVDMDAVGSILTLDIDAAFIDLLAGSDITTGYLNTQLLSQLGDGLTTLLFPGASITLESGGDISTGNISSIDGVYLNAGGSILTGDIDAFDFVEAHSGTSLTTDDIDAGSYVLLTAGTDLSVGAAIASDIDATAGGTATIREAWSAGDVEVTSNDIDIGNDGSISAGDLNLVSTNAAQTVVGDGVAGGGYHLSDAEYDRLDSNDINVIADTGLGAAPNMLLGDLSVDATGNESGMDYEFVTFDGESEAVEGSIRILGEVVFTGMGADDGVTFTTNRFELDAATGLLSLENAPGALGGTLFLDAAHIHVASGDILDQLADDPQYEGYQEDLNAPAAVERPDGVIRAESIEIEFADGGEAEFNTLYVQNTGTEDVPAGFLVGETVLFGEGNEVTPPPGSIDLIINGQIVTEGGTLTGIEVRDALVEAEGDLSPFTENSTINGCLLTGPCQSEGPFPPGFTPTPGIQDEVDLINDDLLPPPEFGNEDFIDDNNDATDEGATSPIKPRHPLFDTSELGGKSDVDDPVSGSGNPALMETPACASEGSQQAGQCKQEKQQ